MCLKDDNLYFVGGYVRDSILGIPSFDIDYCYEGNAIEFARKHNLEILRENPSFGTVRVLYFGSEIDIASTRKETYPQKGHLPKITKIGCTLAEDLQRRDFTINTLAKRTTDGEIIDIYNGKKDLEDKKLRILHDESFIDDPSRIIRGLKFSVRFGFQLDDRTKSLQDEYLNNINFDMSFHRIKKELIETFSLNKQLAYDLFVEQGIYKLLSPEQKLPSININIEKLINKNSPELIWIVYLGLFNLNNLQLTRRERKIIEWKDRIVRESINNNTPKESILLNILRNNSLV